ncbi:MAG: hypothetical protein ACK5XN_37405, partial [Bacteroidota bacterium]
PVPFVIYADGESILRKIKEEQEKNTMIYQNHQVNNLGCKFVSQYPEVLDDEYKEFHGENSMKEFLTYVFEMQNKCLGVLSSKNAKPMDKLTKSERFSYNAANNCHICGGGFKPKSKSMYKVRDHCHMTGKYRGAAHSSCNLAFNYKFFKLPIIFHNLRGYDSHFIFQYIGQFKDMFKPKEELKTEEEKQEEQRQLNITCIPNTMEKYLAFTIEKCVFLDSAQFLAASLESLVEGLNKAKDEKLFKHFNHGFRNSTDEVKQLLRQKGVFPYDWYDSNEKLNYDGLPSQKDFYNKLNECNISDDDYTRAQRVYNLAGCKNFKDYLGLYLKCDVLLLADVFENFRVMTLKYYGLDACHYFTSPGLSFDAMLKMTKAKIECFEEGQEEMLDLIEKNMRGGISMISNRYAKANNEYMKNFDPTEPKTWIMYLDANNLYGGAMSEPLPGGDFKFADVPLDVILNTPKDSRIGYIVQCDLKVPEELHDYFNDYPLAPENCLGEYSKTMQEKYKIINGKNPISTVSKLIPNLRNKTDYVLHYRNLQLYVQLGLEVTKVSKVISFTQEAFLKKYIDFNTDKRSKTKNDYEKDLFKLMNNSVFGKCLENVAKRINVDLMTDSKKFVKKTSKPNFKDFRIFSEGLAAVEMSKTEVVYNRPMIVGFAILELSKLHMYNFHYNVMKKEFKDDIKLLFTDTDSLCYHIKTENFFDFMKKNLDEFDTSEFPSTHECY